jgi:hypothetical protein
MVAASQAVVLPYETYSIPDCRDAPRQWHESHAHLMSGADAATAFTFQRGLSRPRIGSGNFAAHGDNVAPNIGFVWSMGSHY